MPASALNRLLFTRMHSHAGAQKSSGALFRDLERERCRKRPGRVRIALRASQGVRARDVMVNMDAIGLIFDTHLSHGLHAA